MTTSSLQAAIAGEVVGHDNQPVSGALIQAYRIQLNSETTSPLSPPNPSPYCDAGTTRPQALCTTVSDTSGIFHLTSHYIGGIVLVGCCDPYAEPTTTSIQLRAGSTSTVRLRFAPANRFSVLITENGNPVTSASIRISYTYGASTKQMLAESGQDGRTVFENIPAPVIDRIEVHSKMHARYDSREAIALPNENYSIWLTRKTTVEVEVTDPDPAAEKNAATVWLLREKQETVKSGSLPESTSNAHHTVVGHTTVIDGKATFHLIDPGWYKAVAQHSAARGESQRVRVTPGEANTRILVTLEQTAILKGQVTDGTTGQGIPDAQISLYSAGEVPSSMSPMTAQSDAQGNYVLSSVPSGTMKLRTQHKRLFASH